MKITIDIDWSAPRWWRRWRRLRAERRCLRTGGTVWRKPTAVFMLPIARYEECARCGATRRDDTPVKFEWAERS